MQSRRVIASSLIDFVNSRIGLETLSEVPAFSGVIADFLKQIINYKVRNGPSGRILEIAEALVLCQVAFDSIVSWVEGIFPVGAVPCGCPHPSF